METWRALFDSTFAAASPINFSPLHTGDFCRSHKILIGCGKPRSCATAPWVYDEKGVIATRTEPASHTKQYNLGKSALGFNNANFSSALSRSGRADIIVWWPAVREVLTMQETTQQITNTEICVRGFFHNTFRSDT